MSCVLDTNVLIHLRDGDSRMAQRIVGLEGGALMSVVSLVELEGGIYKDPAYAAIGRARLARILLRIPVLTVDEASAEIYGGIVAAVGYSRRKVLDYIIAAQAIAHRASLMTANPADFVGIPGLVLVSTS